MLDAKGVNNPFPSFLLPSGKRLQKAIEAMAQSK